MQQFNPLIELVFPQEEKNEYTNKVNSWLKNQTKLGLLMHIINFDKLDFTYTVPWMPIHLMWSCDLLVIQIVVHYQWIQNISICKNFTLRLVRRVRLTHWVQQAQIAVLDASLSTHCVRTRTLPVRAPQTPSGANPPTSSLFSQP